MSNPYSSYLSKIRVSESSGDDLAHNPHGASGRYQFLPSTWTKMGYNLKDIYNTQLQEEAALRFTTYNANYLKKRLGINPTDADLYGAHFLGPAGYSRLYQTADNAPISSVMSRKEIANNPHVKGKTVGFVKNWLAKKMSIKPTATEGYDYGYGVDTSLNLPTNIGDYQTAPDLADAPTKEDLEAEQAKAELLQKQNEKNFLSEVQARQEEDAQIRQQQEEAYQQQQQNSDIDLSYYQIPDIDLPDYIAPQQQEQQFKFGGKMSGKVICDNCGWSWNKSDSSKEDMYNCHKCGGATGEDLKYQNGGEEELGLRFQGNDDLSKRVLGPLEIKSLYLADDIIEGANNAIDYVGGKLIPHVLPNGLPQNIREKVFEKIRPIQYPKAIAGMIQLMSETKRKPGRDAQGDYDAAEEAWRKSLYLPTKSKYITESKYRPTTAKDKNAKYHTLNNIIDSNKIVNYVKSNNGKKGNKYQMRSLVPYMKDNVQMAGGNENVDPLQEFQISVGEDEKGKYAAIYDIFDLTSSKIANQLIKPYEFYDRYYYKQNGGYQYPNFESGGESGELPKVVKVADKDGNVTSMLSDSKEYQDLYNSGSLNTKDEETGEYTYYLPELVLQSKRKPTKTPIIPREPVEMSQYKRDDMEALLREAAPVRSSIPDYQRMEEVQLKNLMKQEEKTKASQITENSKIKRSISLKSQLEDKIEDKNLDPSKYKTKEDVLKLQSFLQSQGYNLNPEGKYSNNGIDGLLGKTTKEAIQKYNTGVGLSDYQSIKEGTGLLGKCTETQCSEYVQNETFRNLKPNMSREDWNNSVGMVGDAWEIGKNIVKKGGSEIKEKSKIRPGDVVTMYTGGDSLYQSEADRAGTGTTHTGIVDKVNPDGSYYILHNVHKGNKEDGFEGQEYRDLVTNNSTETHNFSVRHIFRPNLDNIKKEPKKVISDTVTIRINPKYSNKLSQGNYNNILTSDSAKQKLEQSFIKPLNDPKNKKVLSSIFNLGDDEYNSLAKASLGIFGQESEFATNKKYTTGIKQAGASLSKAAGYSRTLVDLNEIAKATIGKNFIKEDEVSKGAGQLKYQTNFGEDDLTELGINRNNFSDEDKASLTTMYKLSKDYKNFLKKGYNKKDALYRAITVYNSSLGKKVNGKTVEDYAKKYDVDYTNKVLNYSNIFEVADNKKSYKTTSDNLLTNPNVSKWGVSLKKQNKL